MEYIIRIKVREGSEDEVPSSLPKRARQILSAAFAELIDEGHIDIVMLQTQELRHDNR